MGLDPPWPCSPGAMLTPGPVSLDFLLSPSYFGPPEWSSAPAVPCRQPPQWSLAPRLLYNLGLSQAPFLRSSATELSYNQLIYTATISHFSPRRTAPKLAHQTARFQCSIVTITIILHLVTSHIRGYSFYCRGFKVYIYICCRRLESC